MSASSTAARSQTKTRGKQFWTVEHLTSAPVLLAVSTVLLCAIGLLMVFSSSSVEAVESGDSAWGDFLTQAIYMAISLVFCLIIRATGASFWIERIVFYALWGITLVMLILVLVMGSEGGGAVRWLEIGPFSLQPSEFAKIALVMAAARIFAGWERDEYRLRIALLLLAIFVLVPLILILRQNDLGTLLIIGASIFFMAVLVQKIKVRYLIITAAAIVAVVIVLILTAGYRSTRLSAWLDPYADYYGDGWQPIHGMYAFASGGFLGLGLGNSRQKYSYLPEAQNDYIFAIIGEELGFLGCFVVIALFVLWGWSGMRIAYKARSHSRVLALLAAGLTFMIEVQAFLNMGGVTGLIPLTGRPLPFISTGGSSIVSCLITVGLILGVARDCDRLPSRERPVRTAEADHPHLTVLDGGSSVTGSVSATARAVSLQQVPPRRSTTRRRT